MHFMTVVLLSSLFAACSTHTAHKTVEFKDKLIRGSIIKFEKKVTIANPYKTLPYHKGTNTQVKGIQLSLVKKADVAAPAEAGRSIASSCDFVKFCKLNGMNLKPNEEAVIEGEYTVLTAGTIDTNAIKSWTLVNNDGKEIRLTCGVQAMSKDMNCRQKMTKIHIKDMSSFIEHLLEVKVAAAK